MNKNIDKDSLNEVIGISKKILKLFYLLLLVVGAYLILIICKELHILNIVLSIIKILTPLFIGIVIAWLLNPFVKWLGTKKVRRGIACIFSYVILIGCIILLVQAIIPLLYNQTIELVSNFPNIFSNLKEWTINFFSNFNSTTLDMESVQKNIFMRLDEFSSNLATSLPTMIINGGTALISSIGSFLIGLVIGFFI